MCICSTANTSVYSQDYIYLLYYSIILNGNNDRIIISQRCIIGNNNFVDCVYGEFIRNHLFDEMSSSAILSARNVDVNELNKEVVSLLGSYNQRIYA